uniref:PGG domain-containing protein n=1 Tax=Solanum lycopersicum TaxID=4081 RepID=A0A3Q7HG94_SOLLC|nr:ankyrin repeat-containing protein At5g02620-like [Solanum lycopersicum]XP_010324421.1 ankyrin repeat-containing protein At5g02620-like [Solanum lycopersicum]
MRLLLNPEHDFPANKAGETPLYLAAESGFYAALIEILNVCEESTHVAGPLNRTPLHAAVIQKHTECVVVLLLWKEHLCEEYDVWGWNSLHYAVKQGLTKIVSYMLRRNKSLAYDRAGSENEWTTAFNIAASEGHKAIIHELLRHCPDCWDMVDSNGQNALHVAILNDHEILVNELFELRFCCDRLVDEADNDGNTPLHWLAASGNRVPQMILDHPSVKKMTFNKQNQTPLDIASSRTLTTEKEKLVAVLRESNARLGQRRTFEVHQSKNSRMIDKMKKHVDKDRAKIETLQMEKILKSTEIQVVVATLIMTVAFAAGFTLPGGLENDNGPNKGMSILSKKTAFRVFVISDVLAFTCAAAAIYTYSFMADCDVVAGEINMPLLNVLRMNYDTANNLQRIAMTAVVVAFVTGMYATLENSLALAVSVCVIGCFSFYFFGLINSSWDIKINSPLQTIHELFRS